MPLHATICRYDRVTHTADELVQVGSRLASALSRTPGFVTCALVDAGGGVLISVTVFEDRTELDAADQLVGQWVVEHLAVSPQPSGVVTGEVIVQRGM